jgi:hypothetical protein
MIRTDVSYHVHRQITAVCQVYCGPVLRHPAELMLPAVDLGGKQWLDGKERLKCTQVSMVRRPNPAHFRGNLAGGARASGRTS